MGTNEPIKVNVRLISATNRDLTDAIAAGEFRQDLYHRLKVVSIKLPPLRERREDLDLLIDHFLKEFSASHDRKITAITPAVRKLLRHYQLAGQRARAQERHREHGRDRHRRRARRGRPDRGYSGRHDQQAPAPASGPPPSDSLLGKPLDIVEKHFITETLKLCGGNREEAARVLGIGERTLYRKIKEYGGG